METVGGTWHRMIQRGGRTFRIFHGGASGFSRERLFGVHDTSSGAVSKRTTLSERKEQRKASLVLIKSDHNRASFRHARATTDTAFRGHSHWRTNQRASTSAPTTVEIPFQNEPRSPSHPPMALPHPRPAQLRFGQDAWPLPSPPSPWQSRWRHGLQPRPCTGHVSPFFV